MNMGLPISPTRTGGGPLRPKGVTIIPQTDRCFQPFAIVEEVKSDLILLEA